MNSGDCRSFKSSINISNETIDDYLIFSADFYINSVFGATIFSVSLSGVADSDFSYVIMGSGNSWAEQLSDILYLSNDTNEFTLQLTNNLNNNVYNIPMGGIFIEAIDTCRFQTKIDETHDFNKQNSCSYANKTMIDYGMSYNSSLCCEEVEDHKEVRSKSSGTQSNVVI
uniref:Uncharacterized protein n=1 Tax=Acrobeloides nanus TaxID=290746 RepID=A0A914CMJ9_9BILA